MLTIPYPNPQFGCLTVRSTVLQVPGYAAPHDNRLRTCSLWSVIPCFPDACSKPLRRCTYSKQSHPLQFCQYLHQLHCTAITKQYMTFYHLLDILLGAMEHRAVLRLITSRLSQNNFVPMLHVVVQEQGYVSGHFTNTLQKKRVHPKTLL